MFHFVKISNNIELLDQQSTSILIDVKQEFVKLNFEEVQVVVHLIENEVAVDEKMVEIMFVFLN